jgi:hypothetical protein
MKSTTLILMMAVASLLSLGGVSTVPRVVGLKEVAESAPRNITMMYGDVPVPLAVETFQMPLNLAVLAH